MLGTVVLGYAMVGEALTLLEVVPPLLIVAGVAGLTVASARARPQRFASKPSVAGSNS